MKKAATLFFAGIISFSPLFMQAQMGGWTQRASFPPGGRSAAAGFGLGSAAYISCGIDSAGYKRSTWYYDPAADLWSQLTSLGGITGSGLSRDVAMCFSIGTNAFVVGGQGSIAYMSDTWKYDAVSDTWTQVQSFAGGGRRAGVGFTINGKGYVALGQSSTGLKNDTWEYNPGTNVWTQKALYPGTARRLAVAFVINNIAYVGTGDDGVFKGDFYAYDPSANTWSPKAAFGGTPRYGATGFALNNKGYVGFGYDNQLMNRKDFWEYDPVADTWTQMNNFPGTARSNVTAIALPNNHAYMGLGYDSLYREDWWDFDPLSTGISEQTFSANSFTLFPVPMTDHSTLQFDAQAVAQDEKVTIGIYDLAGNEVKEIMSNGNTPVTIGRGNMVPGVYIVSVQPEKSHAVSRRLVVQ
ncbi:MAG TPA: kelch repeat-containing protein [Bacteroidia bacterium]|nr:kelch repeat-containing protein [Bacteroidia bacterium]